MTTTPTPSATAPPLRPYVPTQLTSYQLIRHAALTLAITHYTDLECEPHEVLETARQWADWIKTGP